MKQQQQRPLQVGRARSGRGTTALSGMTTSRLSPEQQAGRGGGQPHVAQVLGRPADDHVGLHRLQAEEGRRGRSPAGCARGAHPHGDVRAAREAPGRGGDGEPGDRGERGEHRPARRAPSASRRRLWRRRSARWRRPRSAPPTAMRGAVRADEQARCGRGSTASPGWAAARCPSAPPTMASDGAGEEEPERAGGRAQHQARRPWPAARRRAREESRKRADSGRAGEPDARRSRAPASS